jgi:hypothetical protein
MANKVWVDGGSADDLQDVELQGVSGQDRGAVQDVSVVRKLNLRALRVHNAHLEVGRRSSGGCSICGQGLAGLLAEVETGRQREIRVDKSSGTDEEGTASPASVGGASAGESAGSLLWD